MAPLHKQFTNRTSTFILLRIIICILALLFLVGLWYPNRDYGDYFRKSKGNLAAATLSTYRSDASFAHQSLSLESTSGLKVQCGLLVPTKGKSSPPYPAVILLGGMDTGKEAINYVTGMSGVIIAAPDYPYLKKGFSNAAEFLTGLPAMRKAALDTVPGVMLLLDYLSRRPDVDPHRIVLLGYSFGAPFVPCTASYDRRPAVVAMAFGGGGVRKMLRKNVTFAGRLGSEVIASAGALFFRPLEPLRYADKIAPIPLLMINGTRDEKIPAECAVEFFQKAKEPKKLIWLDAKHVHPENPSLTAQIIRMLSTELERMGVLPSRRPG